MNKQIEDTAKYDDIKHIRGSKLTWRGKNEDEDQIRFDEYRFSVNKCRTLYNIELRLIHTEMNISIESNKLVEIQNLYYLLCDLRRFQYLFDGAFYVIQECTVDSENYTAILKKDELGYFQSYKPKHSVQLNMTDKEYKKYFSQWLKLEKQLGIINQMVLYAGNIKGLTSDVRISMLTECFEALAKKLEKDRIINIVPETNKIQNIKCECCGHIFKKTIKGRKTLACCLMAVMEAYGKTVFATEYRRRKSLINHIIKTRNKVFHVNAQTKEALRR